MSLEATDNSEFASIDAECRRMTRVELEVAAAGPTAGLPIMHRARVEIVRRDQEYAAAQERSRRDFEVALVDKQLAAATGVRKATKFAAWAAGLSASACLAFLVIIARAKGDENQPSYDYQKPEDYSALPCSPCARHRRGSPDSRPSVLSSRLASS